MLIKQLSNEQQQIEFGLQLAKAWQKLHLKNFLIYLYGNLGAGKTTLIRGFLCGLGYEKHVKSPTYTLIETYEIEQQLILHVDLYRLHDPNELINLGLLEDIKNCSVCLVEWPEQGGELLPQADIACYIELLGQGREIKMKSLNERGEQVLLQLN